jgi:anoctamin-10
MQIKPLKRSDTTLSDDTELANITYNDKYVVVYDFGSVGMFCVITPMRRLADNR